MAFAQPVEVEACLAAVGGERESLFTTLQSGGMLCGLRIGELLRLELDDRYHDLAGGELARARAAVRVRRVESEAGPKCLITLKGPALDRGKASVRRLELESEWSPDALEAVLSGLGGLGIRIDQTRMLSASPVDRADPELALAAAGFVLIQRRCTTRLAAELFEGRAPVAELAFDQVRYEIGGRPVLHREIEIEALDEEGATRVETIAGGLAALHPGVLRPWPWSKVALGRALEELAEAGQLDALLEGEELSSEGYRRIGTRLAE